MLVAAQLDLLDNDDWDRLVEYEVDATEIDIKKQWKKKFKPFLDF